MGRSHVRPVRVARWFPSDDPVAGVIAQLCILREDLCLELYAMAANEIPRLDDNTASYRRLYFWRNHLRTLEETKNARTVSWFSMNWSPGHARIGSGVAR